MKTKKNISFIFLLMIFSFAFSACVNNFMGNDEGIITINFGGSSANISYDNKSLNSNSAIFPPDDEMKAKMEYEVIFNRNGRNVRTHKSSGNSTISISIRSGIYTIIVNANYNDNPYATGKAVDFEVKAGQRTPLSILLHEVGTDDPGDPQKPDDPDTGNSDGSDDPDDPGKPDDPDDPDDLDEPDVPEEPVYSITMLNGGHGTAIASPNPASEGATVTISASPDAGYAFDRWELVSGGVTLSSTTTNPATFTMPANAVTIKAEFALLPPETPALTLSPVPVNFAALPLGYTQPDAQTVTITNTGNTTANISIESSSASFTLYSLPTTVAAESTETFTVQPNAGLAVGTYSATITVTYSGGEVTNETATTRVDFTVLPVLVISESSTWNLTYANNNALTPLVLGTYTEQTATFTVTVSGFLDEADAANVGLNITTVNGLTFTGHLATNGTVSGNNKTFTITITYNGSAIAAGSAAINVTGLAGFPGNYVYNGGTKTTSVTIHDGQAATETRTIRVNQNNFAAFNAYVGTANRHYQFTEDITLSNTGANNWTRANSFSGSINGNGYSIINLTLTGANVANQGMFSTINLNASIRNLGLRNVSITGGTTTGTFAGANNGLIENCFVSGTVNGDYTVGGIAGTNQNPNNWSNSGIVRNCYVTATVTGSRQQVGGVVGINGTNAIVEFCYATGSVSGGGNRIGGIVGANGLETSYRSIVRNCVGLNPSVSRTDGSTGEVNRICRNPWSNDNPITNNYARADMIVNAAPRTSTDPTIGDGADVDTSDPNGGYDAQSFWSGTVGFNFGDNGVWDWNTTTNLPILRGFNGPQSHTIIMQ